MLENGANFMKKRVVLLIVLIAILSISSSVAGISDTAISEGQTFSVSIIVDPQDSEIYAIQYDIYFDNQALDILNQTDGEFLKEDNTETIVIINKVNNEIGETQYGETRIAAKNGAKSKNVVANLVLTAKQDANLDEAIDITNVILSDASAKSVAYFISREEFDYIITVQEKTTEKISADLLKILEEADEESKINVIILIEDNYETVLEYLQTDSRGENIKEIRIANAIATETTSKIVFELSGMDAVKFIEPDRKISIAEKDESSTEDKKVEPKTQDEVIDTYSGDSYIKEDEKSNSLLYIPLLFGIIVIIILYKYSRQRKINIDSSGE